MDRRRSIGSPIIDEELKNPHNSDTKFINIIKVPSSFKNIFIFMTGIIAALLFYEVVHKSGPITAMLQVPLKQLQHLPSQNYLQTRDDFSIYSASNFDVNVIREFYGELQITQSDDEANVKEALGSLKLAEEMQKAGKDDKAHRLFEHAMALAPKNSEVLLRYGEYLEHKQNDIVSADQFYFQALMLNPGNPEALENRQRTASVVQVIDERRLQTLDLKRDALSGVHETNSALRRAKKEAYFQHIYHSVGIEGNTMTLAQTRSILETRMAVDGKSIDEHNEILGLDLAMKYINASLVNKMEITLKDILEIHRRVLGHVDPIEGGEFRRTQVYVGGHIPPGPGDLAILMNQFENWLNAEQTISLHPVKHAALAHYKLVHIHPFVDGNGRTSRLLMNTLLMRAGYPPVIIPKHQRHKYYSFLQLANEGDIRPFVRFIAECTEKTLDLYLWATSDLPHQIPMLVQNDHELGYVENFFSSNAHSRNSRSNSKNNNEENVSPSTNSPTIENNQKPPIEATSTYKTPITSTVESVEFFESGSGEIP